MTVERLQITTQHPFQCLALTEALERFIAIAMMLLAMLKLQDVERFATTQPGNANLQFMADSYRAKAAVYENRPDDAEKHEAAEREQLAHGDYWHRQRLHRGTSSETADPPASGMRMHRAPRE